MQPHTTSSAPATQTEKAQRFQALHAAESGFIIPNPWDPGSARLLASLGFQALATTSAGFAFSRGLPDGKVPRDLMMQHLAELCASTHLPISADLLNGFGPQPSDVARCIIDAAQQGVVGGSIEDSTGDAGAPIMDFSQAVERVAAAVEAARSLPFPFTLTARAENHFAGISDLDDTIRRLVAFQEAGADVLFAPGLARREDIAEVLKAIDRPFNVLIGVPGMSLNAQELLDMGVRRISVGGSLARTALGALMSAATELRDKGTTGYKQSAVRGADLNKLFSDPGANGGLIIDPHMA
jgi:2-methylisocitrate lyase-like PEP mutase family enzyme